MRIQRQTRRSNWPLFGCFIMVAGCAMTLVVLALLILPALPEIALRVAGFDRRGTVDTIFQPDASPPDLNNLTTVSGPAVLELGPYGSVAVSQYNLMTGTDGQGASVARLTLDEASMTTLCNEYTDVCSTGNSQLRNARIDLRPGGAIIYADMYVPQIATWQNLGAVVQVDGNQATVVGIDVNGTLYSSAENAVGGLIMDLEHIANNILTQVALNAAGSRYTLDTIYVNDQELTLILR